MDKKISQIILKGRKNNYFTFKKNKKESQNNFESKNLFNNLIKKY